MITAFINFWSNVPVRWRLLLNVLSGLMSMSGLGLGVLWLALNSAGSSGLWTEWAVWWGIGSVAITLVMVAICEFVVWDINRAIFGLRAAMMQLNEFNMQVQAPLEGQYEVVDVARRLNVMVDVWRSLLSNVSNAILNLQGTSDGLKSAAHSMHNLGDEQREDMGELTLAADTVAQMAMEVENNARQIDGCAEKASNLSHESGDAILRLETQTQAVGEMSDMIEDVAGKINLLALNASIEAARAGDSGLGFAVVAQEVRKLSMETTTMAQEIREKVESLRGVVNEVSQGSEGVKTYIQSIREEVQSVVVSTGQQSRAATEMAQGVSRFCERLDELAKRIADADNAACAVADGSSSLRQEANRFKV